MAKSSTGPSREKRKYPRYAISGTGDLALGANGPTLRGKLLDVSIAGVGLMVAHELVPPSVKEGSSLGTLYMDAADLPGPVSCEATVARKIICFNGDVLFGLEITTITDTELAKLRAYTVLANIRRSKNNSES